MSSKLLRFLLCAVLLLGFSVTATQAVVNLESGKIGVRISDAGSIRFVVPTTSGTRQIERLNIIAALNEQAVCDYNEDQDKLINAYTLTPTLADVEGGAYFSNISSKLPPNVKFRLRAYLWTDQPYAIASYTIINDSSQQVTLHLGAVALPRIGGNYGGETDSYHAASKTAYCFRDGQAAFAGYRLLSHDTYSYIALDWKDYSPADPASDASTDSIRYHQTADRGFSGDIVAGGDGSLMSLNAGAFTLAPHDSTVLVYGLVYGGSLAEMVSASEAMYAKFQEKFPSTKTTWFESGQIGIRLSDAGSIRLYVPNTDGMRQIDRINLTAALSEKEVCDYNENHNPLAGTEMLAFPTKSDVEGAVDFDSRYVDEEDPSSVPQPPNLLFHVHTYMWDNQPYVIAEYTVTNDSSAQVDLHLGAVVLPRINGNYGGETDSYDVAAQTAYCYREGEAGYAGIRLLSRAPYSFKALDWSVYSPEDPNNDAATDSTRYHQTADPGFDAAIVAGGDGSLFSLNAGSYTLAPHASVTLTYGIMYGNTLEEMLAASNAMQAKYADITTGVERKADAELPVRFTLTQNWPNPFNPSTTIQFGLMEKSDIHLSIYNLKGQMVRTIASGVFQPGVYSVIWNGKDEGGRDVAAGVYLYRMQSEKQGWTKKMILVR